MVDALLVTSSSMTKFNGSQVCLPAIYDRELYRSSATSSQEILGREQLLTCMEMSTGLPELRPRPTKVTFHLFFCLGIRIPLPTPKIPACDNVAMSYVIYAKRFICI